MKPLLPSASCIWAIAAPGFSATVRSVRRATEVFGHEFHYASTVSVSGDSLVDCRDASGSRACPNKACGRARSTGTFFHVIDGAAAMTETPDPSPRQFDAGISARRSATSSCGAATSAAFAAIRRSSALMYSLLELASHAPSVGHCQPWRFVLVESAERRERGEIQLRARQCASAGKL